MRRRGAVADEQVDVAESSKAIQAFGFQFAAVGKQDAFVRLRQRAFFYREFGVGADGGALPMETVAAEEGDIKAHLAHGAFRPLADVTVAFVAQFAASNHNLIVAAGERLGAAHGIGDDGEVAMAGKEARQAGDGTAGIQINDTFGRNQAFRQRGNAAFFLLMTRGFARIDVFQIGAGGQNDAVAFVQNVAVVQLVQVFADGFAGDVEGFGKLGHARLAVAHDVLHDFLPPLGVDRFGHVQSFLILAGERAGKSLLVARSLREDSGGVNVAELHAMQLRQFLWRGEDGQPLHENAVAHTLFTIERENNEDFRRKAPIGAAHAKIGAVAGQRGVGAVKTADLPIAEDDLREPSGNGESEQGSRSIHDGI